LKEKEGSGAAFGLRECFRAWVEEGRVENELNGESKALGNGAGNEIEAMAVNDGVEMSGRALAHRPE